MANYFKFVRTFPAISGSVSIKSLSANQKRVLCDGSINRSARKHGTRRTEAWVKPLFSKPPCCDDLFIVSSIIYYGKSLHRPNATFQKISILLLWGSKTFLVWTQQTICSTFLIGKYNKVAISCHALAKLLRHSIATDH